MPQGRWERLAPLTGILFVAVLVCVFAFGGSTPDVDSSAIKVQAFYADHHDKHMVLSLAMGISIPFLLFFVSCLRHDLRRAGGTGQLANAAFAGGVLAGAGFGLLATVHLALAEAGSHAKTLATVQTLNVLDNDDWILGAVGLGLLVLAAGASAVRHGGLPKWFSWVGVVVGILVFTPAGFFAVLLCGLWIAVASVLLTRTRHVAPAAAAAT